jgi:hypothetical protein
MLRAAIAFYVLLALGSSASAEKRVALVMGNGAYMKVPKLPNPANDFAAMASLLRQTSPSTTASSSANLIQTLALLRVHNHSLEERREAGRPWASL